MDGHAAPSSTGEEGFLSEYSRHIKRTQRKQVSKESGQREKNIAGSTGTPSIK